MRLVLRPLVERDLDRATSWYEKRQPRLREAFLERVGETLSRIEHNPLLYEIVDLDIRRAPLRQFPYGVYYFLTEDEIRIFAVVHDSRHPSVWRRRH